MTLVELVGFSTGVFIFAVMLFVVIARSSKRTRATVATTSTASPLVGAGTIADRIFGGFELIAAALILVLAIVMTSGAANIPATLAFLSGSVAPPSGCSHLVN